MVNRHPDIQTLAGAYRRLVVWVGIQLLLSLGSALVPASSVPGPLGPVLKQALAAAMLLSVFTVLISTYRTARALGSSRPTLWVVAMFLPLVNVISLLVLSSHASAICRMHNVPVGILGPRLPAGPPPPRPPLA